MYRFGPRCINLLSLNFKVSAASQSSLIVNLPFKLVTEIPTGGNVSRQKENYFGGKVI